MQHVCGTCRWARDEGRGRTICTHSGGHHCTVITTSCKQPRRWWEERAEPITDGTPAPPPDHHIEQLTEAQTAAVQLMLAL
jgi:hypothetical protein